MPAVEPVTSSSVDAKHIVAYEANIDSLKILELSLERDESNLFADITSLAVGTDDGKEVTVVTYEDVPDFKMGHLTLANYSTTEDQNRIKQLHDQAGEVFLFAGEAFVTNNKLKVLVFREKPTS